MKVCNTCKENLSDDCFYVNRSRPGGLQGHCKECGRRRSRERYHNVSGAKEYTRETAASIKARIQVFIFNYLMEHPCVDCGNDNPLVLEFDHLDEKNSAISKMLTNRRPLVEIEKEIALCEVVCANCHKIRTATRANNYRFKLYNELGGSFA